MEPIADIHITGPDGDWLMPFARGLVEDHVAASVNIVPAVRSVYRWQGEVQDGDEVLVIVHTRESLTSDVIERATNEHPYEVPGIRVTGVDDALPSYHRWVIDSTQQ